MAGITLINSDEDDMDKYHTAAYSYFNYFISNEKSPGEINTWIVNVQKEQHTHTET